MTQTTADLSAFTEMVKKEDIFIAVMGLTGSGKSSLIAACTGQEVSIGHRLQSYTMSTSMFSFTHVDQQGNVSRVHLIDTPGFDDTQRTDSQVLQEILFWLSQGYDNGLFLDGVVYLHDINAPRFDSAHQRSFDLLKALVGEKAYKCVYLAATRWDEARKRGKNNLDLAYERHDEMEDEIWRPLIAKGAKMHQAPDEDKSGVASYAWSSDMIEYFVQKSTKHVLQIQTELQQAGTGLDTTTAGKIAKAFWSKDPARRGQIVQLQNSKQELVEKWTKFVQDDVSKLQEEIRNLGQQIGPSSRPFGHNSRESSDFEREVKERREELYRQKQLKLASHGMWVNVAGASFGLASAVVGGVAAAAACTVM